MRLVQVEIARLHFQRAKLELDRARAATAGKTKKPTKVQVEYVDDLDIVIIRGAKESVDKIKNLISKANKETKPKE
jgi:hypothetical protein